MAKARNMSTVEAYRLLENLARQVVSHGDVPDDAAQVALRVARAFVVRSGGSRTPAALEAYFRKVVARRLVRGYGGTVAAARLVADRVVSDMVESGRTAEEAYDELVRGWTDKLPSGLLAEYRERLCA